MADQKIKTIIQHRHDTEANWNTSNYTPLAGELIVYDVDNNYSYERFKIGDGKTEAFNLPFASAAPAELEELGQNFSAVIYEMYGDDVDQGADAIPTIRNIAADEANKVKELIPTIQLITWGEND